MTGKRSGLAQQKCNYLETMTGQQQFEDRVRTFSGVRRGVLNSTMFFRLGTCLAATGVAALLLLNGWIPFALLNAALFILMMLLGFALILVFALRYERFRAVLPEAFHMESLAGGLNSRLISAWDFYEQQLSGTLVEAVQERAAADLQAESFEGRINRGPRNRWRRRFAGSVTVLIVLALTPWVGVRPMVRNLHHTWLATLEYFFPVDYELIPGPGVHVVRLGEALDIGVRIRGRVYREISLVQQILPEGEPTERRLDVGDDNTAASTVTSAAESHHRIQFKFGDRLTETMEVIFTARPAIVNMQAEMIYPAYTRLLPRTLEGIQQRLVALAGTRLTLGFTLSKDLESATVTWESGEQLPLDVVGRFASISLIHSQARTGRLQVADRYGFGLEFPLLLEFELLNDEPPQLFLPKHIGEDIPLLADDTAFFGFGVRLQDDYGVTRCVLKWQKSTVDNPSSVIDKGEIERLISPVLRKATVNYEKVFDGMRLAAGDRISFFIEAEDNRAPDKQKVRSRSASLFVYQQDLAGLSISELGFGGGRNLLGGRIAKAKRATSVMEPEGLRRAEKVKNEFRAEMHVLTAAPTMNSEHSAAARDYFRLLSGVKFNEEK